MVVAKHVYQQTVRTNSLAEATFLSFQKQLACGRPAEALIQTYAEHARGRYPSQRGKGLIRECKFTGNKNYHSFVSWAWPNKSYISFSLGAGAVSLTQTLMFPGWLAASSSCFRSFVSVLPFGGVILRMYESMLGEECPILTGICFHNLGWQAG